MKGITLAISVFIISSISCFADTDKTDISSIAKFCEVNSEIDILSIEDQNWISPTHRTFKISKPGNSIWVKLNSNAFNSNFDYLVSSNPNLDLIQVYVDGILIQESGDKVPFRKRQIKDAYPTIKLEPFDSIHTIMIKLSMDEDFIIPLELHSESSYFHLISTRNILIGVYIGIMAAILIYNFLLFLSIKNRLLLYYCFYVLFVALTQLSIYSHYSNYLFPNSIFLLQRDVYLFSSILGIVCAPFLIQLLELSKRTFFKTVVLTFVFLYIILFVLSFLSNLSFIIQILSLVNFLSSIFIISMSLYLIKKVTITKYFLLAWIIFLVGAISFILTNYNFVPYNIVVFHLMPIGTAIETMLLSLALGYRVNLLVKDNKLKDQIIKEQDEKISKLNRQTKHSELLHLNGHMQPHFLFNAVTSVQNYIQKNQRERAVHYLARYSKLMRHNLEIGNREFVSLEEEIDFITNYIEMESLRMEIPIKFEITHDLVSEIDELNIPPMIIQPVVENCFKHAFKPEIRSGLLKITLKELEDTILIKVIDNGVGFTLSNSKPSHRSYALTNINKRIHYYNEKNKTLKYSINYTSVPKQETIIELKLPIQLI